MRLPPVVDQPAPPTPDPPFDGGPRPAGPSSLSTDVGAATIDEMLELMAKQIMQVIAWTQAEGFLDAYRKASPNARGLFHTASIKLAARADQLRRG